LCSCGRKADVIRRGRWEAAYVELLLGANQKLAGEEPSFLRVYYAQQKWIATDNELIISFSFCCLLNED
jgi:hypothetical protein